MRFFVDQCVPRSVSEFLSEAGHQVDLLKDYIPVDSPDGGVIKKAHERNTILVTLNGDFADIVMYPPENYGGIIALQVRNRPEAIPQMLKRLNNYLESNPTKDHYTGKLMLVESHRIRVR